MGFNKDFKSVDAQILETQALSGDVDAQIYVASLYLDGSDDFIHNVELAQYWLKVAAKKANPVEKGVIAHLFRKTGDTNSAINCYSESSVSGCVDSMYRLGLVLNEVGDYDSSLAWFTKAGESGDLKSQLILGDVFYKKGEYRDSFLWYSKAGEQDDPDALNQIGLFYLNGRGVQLDRTKATLYIEKSYKLKKEKV